jgi:hypothetical protein
MPFRAKTEDDDKLYRCAKFCYEAAKPMLASLPMDRASQRKIVDFLREKIGGANNDFSIDVEFLRRKVGCTDSNLVGRWTASPNDLAWFMVHEQLSDYFPRFVIDNWNPEIYLIHHVPKSAGTSVCEAVHMQSCFVAYPQTGFRLMKSLLGFGRQLAEFEKQSRTDRIYIGGHFNLPKVLTKLGRDIRCRGISLARAPIASMSSAIRYVWTNVEQGDAYWTNACSSLDPAMLTMVREAAVVGNSAGLKAMREISETLLKNGAFQENYFDLFGKYYYDDQVNDLYALRQLFLDNPELVPCTDAARDAELICAQLKIDGALPHLNESLFSHSHLARAFGGDDAFMAAVAPASLQSAEIYGSLCMLYASKTAPRTAQTLVSFA